MPTPDYLDRLLEMASAAAGSDYRLAQMLEVNRATVSQWRSGKRTCPPADVALMAKIAGLDAAAWHARATVEAYAGTSKGDKLYLALGKALLATGAVIASSGAAALPIFSHETINRGLAYFIRCIETLSYKQLNCR